MAIVVSDTSPIRALAQLQCLPWLSDLFATVVMPPAVVQELENPPPRLPAVHAATWQFMSVQPPQNLRRVNELRLTLDLGEAEAIALAEEIRADAILIDEAAGRGVAQHLGLTVVGTLGILLRAKQTGLCREINPLLVRLRQEIHFFVSPALLNKILQQAQELPPKQ